MKYKICHLTTVHPPYDTRIFIKMCKSLAKYGYDVTLVARSEIQDEIIDGVKIHSLKKRNTGRIIRFFYSIKDGLAAILFKDYDIIHFHDPELIPLGVFLKILGCKVIYDVHEDISQQVYSKKYIPNWLCNIVSAFCRYIELIAILNFDGFSCATPFIGRRFPKRKTQIVQNFPIVNELTSPITGSYEKRKKQVCYIGVISEVRGIIEIIRAMEYVETPNVILALGGNFSPKALENKILGEKGWNFCKYYGFVDRKKIAEIFLQSRVGLVLFHPESNHINAQPNKFFEYMSSGLPIIASNFPLWKKIIEKIQCGLVVDPLQPKSIAKAIDWILDNPRDAYEMGQRGKTFVQDVCNWEVEFDNLQQLYKRILR